MCISQYVYNKVNDARGIYDLTIINLGWCCQDVLCQLVQPKPYLNIQFGYILWYSYKNIRIIHSVLNTNVPFWIEKFQYYDVNITTHSESTWPSLLSVKERCRPNEDVVSLTSEIVVSVIVGVEGLIWFLSFICFFNSVLLSIGDWSHWQCYYEQRTFVSSRINRKTNSTALSLCNACKVEISVLEDIISATEELYVLYMVIFQNFSISCQQT